MQRSSGGYFLRGGLTYGIHISSHKCDRPVSEALIWKSQTSGRRKANRPRELRLVHRWRIWPEIRAQKMREDLYQTIKLPGNVGAEKLSGGEDLVWFDSIEAWNLWHLCPIYSTWAAIASFNMRRCRGKLRPHRRPRLRMPMGGGHTCANVCNFTGAFSDQRDC